MTTLPPRDPYSSIGRKSESRRVAGKRSSASHTSAKNAAFGLSNMVHVGATRRDPPLSSTSHGNSHGRDRLYQAGVPDQQLSHDFELACNLAAEELPEDDRAGFWTNYYDEQLQERAQTSRRKQDAWYDGNIDQSRHRETTRRELFLQNREEREQIIREESEAYYRVQEERTASRRARLAAQAEQRRIDLEEQQRAREEAIAAGRTQLAAEEERRRREAEEAEQRRRDLERECTVCLESGDMWAMIEAPCGHWYCREDLQSKKARAIQPVNTTS